MIEEDSTPVTYEVSFNYELWYAPAGLIRNNIELVRGATEHAQVLDWRMHLDTQR